MNCPVASKIESTIQGICSDHPALPQVLVNCAFRAASAFKMAKLSDFSGVSAIQASDWGDTLIEFSRLLYEKDIPLSDKEQRLVDLGLYIMKEAKALYNSEMDKLIGKVPHGRAG